MKTAILSSEKLLFPHKFRLLGILLIIPGIILGIIRFYYGIKPPIFDLKVFAVYSKYVETFILTTITNHFSEEISGILVLIGLVFIALSQEKNEINDLLSIRLYSLILSIYINSVILLISFIFIFGLGFVNVLIINIYSQLIIYLIVFQISKQSINRRIQ